MCVGIPVQVLRPGEGGAWCRRGDGSEAWIDTLLTGPQPAGAWLLTFLGAARDVIDATDAQRTQAALDALDALLKGESPDLDAAFADLLERPPQLPDFLRKTPS